MARTVVLIFLLDTLPEIPRLLNQTLQQTLSKNDPHFTLQRCNNIMATSILQRAHLEMNEKVPNYKLFQTKGSPLEDLRKLPPDSAYNEEDVYDNSIRDSDENPLEDIRDFFDKNDMNINDSQEIKEIQNTSVSKGNAVDAESAPFLVAIFESVSSVTANTCAGTLLSAHWVVTAAGCVGVLSGFYGNSTEKSRYTVVAGSTNPLIDGSIHNVTEIILNAPSKNMDHQRNVSEENSLNAKKAMMRISPRLAVEKMKILEDADVSDAMVYGWTLAVNESTMLPTSIAVKRTNWTQAKDNATASASALSFIPEPMVARNSTKLGVGGPAMVRGEMLGVVLDDRLPFLVETFAAHAWILDLINRDNKT